MKHNPGRTPREDVFWAAALKSLSRGRLALFDGARCGRAVLPRAD